MDPYEDPSPAGPAGHGARAVAWVVACVVSIVLLIPATAAFTFAVHWLEQQGVTFAEGVINLLGLGVFAGVILGVGRITSRIMDRRYPDTPVRSANWEDSPGMMRK